MNNNKFEWNRFCKVVYKDFRNIWPTFGITLLVIALLPMGWWLLFMVLDTKGATVIAPNYRMLVALSVPMLVSILTPARLYRTINLRGEGIYFAMLPASKLEKFLSILLYTLIVCPLLVLVASVLLDTLLWLLPFGCYQESIFSCDILEWYKPDTFSDFPQSALTMLWVASVFGNITTSLLFLFTATLFRRHKVIQTLLWLWLISFVLSLVLMPLLIHFFNSDSLQRVDEYIMDHVIDWASFINWCSAIIMVISIALAVLFGWLSWNRIKKMPY